MEIPKFVKQMVKFLCDLSLIFFCCIDSKWKLDAKKIGEHDAYENVNDLLRLLNQINADLVFY